jgi:hypothetical protein
MPTAALIARSGALLKHRRALWEAGQGSEAGLMSSAWAQANAALEAHRLEVAQHHRQEAAKTAALNVRRQARQQLAGNN